MADESTSNSTIMSKYISEPKWEPKLQAGWILIALIYNASLSFSGDISGIVGKRALGQWILLPSAVAVLLIFSHLTQCRDINKIRRLLSFNLTAVAVIMSLSYNYQDKLLFCFCFMFIVICVLCNCSTSNDYCQKTRRAIELAYLITGFTVISSVIAIIGNVINTNIAWIKGESQIQPQAGCAFAGVLYGIITFIYTDKLSYTSKKIPIKWALACLFGYSLICFPISWYFARRVFKFAPEWIYGFSGIVYCLIAYLIWLADIKEIRLYKSRSAFGHMLNTVLIGVAVGLFLGTINIILLMYLNILSIEEIKILKQYYYFASSGFFLSVGYKTSKYLVTSRFKG